MINSTRETPTLLFVSNFPYGYEHLIVQQILYPIWLVIFPFGIISNITNVFVFTKSGVQDNVTILFLWLSVSDLCFLVLMTPWLVTTFIIIFVPNWDWTFDRNITALLFYWPAFTLYDFSAYVSVFLGVTRCACVAMPLHFKSVFTKSRTIISVVVLFVCTILLRLPVLMISSIGMKLNPVTNRTYAYLKRRVSPTNVLINDTLNRTSLPWVAFIIMVACVIILSVKLREASKVRQSSTFTYSSASDEPMDRPDIQKHQGSSNYKMSAKEIQVVQSVVLVCLIFILSQLPFLLYSTARLIHPEFDRGKKLQFLFGIITKPSLTCSFLSASINIFIYYNYNSKYRSTLKSIFRSKLIKS